MNLHRFYDRRENETFVREGFAARGGASLGRRVGPIFFASGARRGRTNRNGSRHLDGSVLKHQRPGPLPDPFRRRGVVREPLEVLRGMTDVEVFGRKKRPKRNKPRDASFRRQRRIEQGDKMRATSFFRHIPESAKKPCRTSGCPSSLNEHP